MMPSDNNGSYLRRGYDIGFYRGKVNIFLLAPPETTCDFDVSYWFSVCAMWWRRKVMKSGNVSCSCVRMPVAWRRFFQWVGNKKSHFSEKEWLKKQKIADLGFCFEFQVVVAVVGFKWRSWGNAKIADLRSGNAFNSLPQKNALMSFFNGVGSCFSFCTGCEFAMQLS